MHFFFITRNCEIKDDKINFEKGKVANFILILFHIKALNLIFKDKFYLSFIQVDIIVVRYIG